ncbi:RecX family transcriptional regulator [Candidatus Dojkabacteria bacterium]|uniref:Regulatory protein RecX n=1 Tax=Candidatus Dojkabacteria bacterium TaxID=2099670 RepID=A0A955L714_9BACT|nr:RecX family transcriptional regulator [Candidatus Dojkabacteria bacterium]
MSRVITAIYPTRNNRRINIAINDSYAFTVEKALGEKYSLVKGMEVSEELEKILKSEDEKQKLQERVLRKLARRAHSKYEIRQYIRKQISKLTFEEKIPKDNTSDEWEEAIITFLDTYDYLDDVSYATSVIRSKRSSKSPFEMRGYLRQKGVNSQDIETALQEEELNPTAVVRELIEKKIRQLKHKNLSVSDMRRKIVQYLTRKGFRYGTIIEVLEELL